MSIARMPITTSNSTSEKPRRGVCLAFIVKLLATPTGSRTQQDDFGGVSLGRPRRFHAVGQQGIEDPVQLPFVGLRGSRTRAFRQDALMNGLLADCDGDRDGRLNRRECP